MSDLRQNPRIPENADVSVRIESSPEARNLEGRVFISNSIDISLGGLQITVEFPIPVDASLELKVTFHSSSKTYWHKGIVIWDDELDSHGKEYKMHRVGVEFNTLDNPQFFAWRAAISELLNKSTDTGSS
ncbi:MAG: hypothetical protein A3I78_06475 [Gammaproteobacteria bacterium RIFCSPLOWO2_02_FULL_56_15]|nr:MAG: hypothetical protein A3I78_06475 [Gammaproteobacteria bacterium RIFCSPLOWO2_02_FULL_56_15]